MALKMGGFVCDRCRKIITASYDLSKVPFKRKGKKNQWLHYCTLDCLDPTNEIEKSNSNASYRK